MILFLTHFMISYDMIWYHMMPYDIIWYHMTSYDIIWHHMISYDIIWYHMMSDDIIWCHMMLYDRIWYVMITYGRKNIGNTFFLKFFGHVGDVIGYHDWSFWGHQKIEKIWKFYFFLKLSIDLWAMIWHHHWLFLARK